MRQISGGLDGWIPAEETWTYASASTFTISGDKTSKYQTEDKLKLTNSTAKYFRITAISYSSPNTTVTVDGFGISTLADAAITDPSFSKQDNPQGFPRKEVPLFSGTAAANITLSETSANFDRLLVSFKDDTSGATYYYTTILDLQMATAMRVTLTYSGLYESAYKIRTGTATLTASGTSLTLSGSGANYSTDTTSVSAVIFSDVKIVPKIVRVLGYRW